MIHIFGGLAVGLTPLWHILQVPDTVVTSATDEAAYIFSGPQFFIALIAGLILAFAFQLLLTNLSVATGISVLDFRPSRSSHQDSSSGGLGQSVRQHIGAAMGLWTLVTVTIALFFACLLAVHLIPVPDDQPGLGIIIGLVIWGTYFTAMVWLSSAKVGSLFGSVVGMATSSFQKLFGAATAAVGAKAANDQIVETAEAAASAVRRELTAGWDARDVQHKIEDYISQLRPSQIDAQALRREFEGLLASNPDLQQADSEMLRSAIDRQAFVDVVRSRTDLSQREVEQVASQLEDAWLRSVGRSSSGNTNAVRDLVDYVRTAHPERLLSEELGQRLDQLLNEMRLRRQSQSNSAQQSLMQLLNGLMGVAMGRIDLSDLDAQTISSRLKSAGSQISSQANQLISSSDQATSKSVIRSDIENYLLNAYSWQMKPATVERDFRAILYDPDADPSMVRHELDQIGRPDFVSILKSRGVFTQERIQNLANHLERIRREVRIVAYEAEARAIALELRQRVETFILTTPKTELANADYSRKAFKAILETPDTEYSVLRPRLETYDRNLLRELLLRRADVDTWEVDNLINPLEEARNQVLDDAKSMEEKAQEKAKNVQQRLENYLRSTGREELNPDAIEREITMLLNDPQVGFAALRNRLSQMDRETLVQLLSQRQDMSESDVNHTIDQVEETWHRALRSPKSLSVKAQEQYDHATSAIADYLRSTGKSELNPEGIQRDLQKLIDDPQAGASALRDRLSQMDRDTLVQLLSQREDLTEAEVNEKIDQIQSAIRSILRAPRRLALRTQEKVQSFETALEDYLRNTDKDELSPEGIKRDLRTLFDDPRLGAERISDRVSRIDRSTLVALLSQREDISEAEAQRIVGQILSIRDQALEQIRQVQYRIQAAIDSIMARIRSYLNSLDRPELNYYGIKQDIRLLFDDPETGFDALRHRLSSVNRDTLVAILSSRNDISAADADRIIAQVEDARDSVLQQAERLQMEVDKRMSEMKHLAQRQLDETRKVAAVAAWWLFATALVSAFASGLAGGIAAS
ncbi:MAG: MFS transporter [Thainema sp.]